MERPFTALFAVAAALTLASGAVAQSVEPAAPSTQSAQVSDEDLATFAEIYQAIEASLDKHEAALAGAKTEQEASDVQKHFEEESSATLSAHGWTVDKYNSVVKTINADPVVAERAAKLIND